MKYEFSQVQVPVGTISDCGYACVGRAGHMFLIKGSNLISEQYKVPEWDEHVQEDCKNWVDLIGARYRKITELGADFLQVIAPEKNSVLSEFLPESIHVPSSRHRVLMRGLRGQDIPDNAILDVFKVFSNSMERGEFFRKLDTHFSTSGAISVVEAMLANLGESVDIPRDVNCGDYRVCDLGPKLLKGISVEPVLDISERDMAALSDGLKVVDEFNPESGAHIGTRRVFSRASAPVGRKVVVFGDSFFATGRFTTHLSWWFARIFREFHFIWSPSVDYDYIEKHRPDIVISQTTERFLPVVPQQ